MKLMLKSTMSLAFVAVAAGLVAGCASSGGVKNPSGVPVTRMNPDEQGFVAGTGVESQDLVAVTNRLGIFHCTDVGYDSALRWWRSSRFMADKSMGVSVGVGVDGVERLSLIAPGGGAPGFITLERRWERVDGGALVAMVAHTGDANIPIVTWENPFHPIKQGHGGQWHDDEIGVAGCMMSRVEAVRSNKEVTYGPYQARLDQEIILALRMSSNGGGQPIRLPLDPEQQEISSKMQ